MEELLETTVSGNDVSPDTYSETPLTTVPTEQIADPVQEPVLQTVVETVETYDYTGQLNMLNESVNLGFMFTVFFIGVLSGVLLGKILWERVHV